MQVCGNTWEAACALPSASANKALKTAPAAVSCAETMSDSEAPTSEIIIPDYDVPAASGAPTSAGGDPAFAATSGGVGGGGASAGGLDGVLEKLRVFAVPPADDSVTSKQAAKLQSDLMNITFWCAARPADSIRSVVVVFP
jgi:hypothetical protein